MSSKWLVPAVIALSSSLYSLGHDELAFLGKLQLAHVVFRHGARSPVFTYPTDTFPEDRWGVKWGQLTQLGEEQQLALGAYLRSRYADVLSPDYDSGEALFRSSGADRVLVSSGVLAAGLYPPLSSRRSSRVPWQIVPVHSCPEDLDQLLPVFASPCAAFFEEVERVNRSIEYQCFKARMSYLEELSAKVSGAPAMVLYDSLKAKAHHGLVVPFWSRRMFPHPLSSYNDWNVFFGVASTEPLRRMFVGTLLHEILKNMEMKMESSLVPDRKLFAYGGHDTNLLALLSSMKVWNGIIPPFSACIMVELRLNSKREHVVTVSYKNDTSEPPHLLKIPGCSSAACPYPEFLLAVGSEAMEEGDCEEKPDSALPLVFNIPTRHLPDEWKQCFDL